MSFPVTCGGAECAKVMLHVPGAGPWFADCALTNADIAAPSGAVELVIGDVTLRGTIDGRHSGTFGGRRSARVVAGGGGWGKAIAAKPYANDAGVKAADVAKDAAVAAGETLGATPGDSLGNHFTREAGPASRAIDIAAGGLSWWVDFGGVTQVGKRFSVPAAATARVLDYEPMQQRATLTVESLNNLPIGATLSDSRWTGALTVASLEVTIDDSGLRVSAWLGNAADNLLETMRRLIGRLMPPQLVGTYKYRVVRMNVDRVDLQIVNKAAGLPDLATVDMWPGISGAHAELTPGTLVAVTFLDGSRADPIITSFVGRGGPGNIPKSLTLGPVDTANPAARKADTVTMMWPPMAFVGQVNSLPASGVLTALVGQTLGTITTGSAKVSIG